MLFALLPDRLFDGDKILNRHGLVIENGKIQAVLPANAIDPVLPRRHLEGLLAPGFIDVQVNGGGGIQFNDVTTAEGIAGIGAAHRRFGTTGFMVTLISDTREKTAEAMRAAASGLALRIPGLLGAHIEGPFLNVERRGVHAAAMIRALEPEDLAILTSLRTGRTLVTLAPEKVPGEDIRRLVGSGVIVAAGHTAADHATVRQALELGLTGFTHLYNAMPPLAGREPGPVGAALEDRGSWCGIIADLHHVSATSLKVAIAAKGFERMMLVTDAMATVGSDLQEFIFQGQKITRAGGRLTTAEGRAAGTLAGSDLDMATAVRNTVRHLGLPLEQALAMASRVPAAFLRLEGELGRILPGFRASLVLLDDDLQVLETWIDGVGSPPSAP